MSKIKFIFIIALLISAKGVCQTPSENHNKYWYYRYRYLNDFILVGDCIGCSLPATERNRVESNGTITHTMKWGEPMKQLSYYFIVLATEYKLLTNNNQDASQTIKELYYALKAFNRMDESAESYWRCYNCPPTFLPDDLNGFFLRSDVGADFLSPNVDYVTNDEFSSNYEKFNQGITLPSIVNNVESNLTTNIINKAAPSDESLDDVNSLLVGLAMIAKLVPEGINYNSLALNNKNFNADIAHEAVDIADRIILWVNNSGDWRIRNPLTGDCVRKNGSDKPECSEFNHSSANEEPLCYGLAEAGHDITRRNYGNALSDANLFCWEQYQYDVSIPLNKFEDPAYQITQLAAVGNSWHFTSPTIIPCLPVPPNPLINTTATAISTISSIHGHEHLPIVRQVLHGGTNLISKDRYEDLLNSAPCQGPYNYGNCCGGYAAFDWSVSNRFRSPLSLGNATPDFGGEYDGLDYMALFNLYCLANEDYVPGYFNQMDRVITLDFPLSFFPHTGSKINPAQVNAFNTITAYNHISAGADDYTTGDVTYRAGRSIALLPGFGVDAGAEFGAFIQPFQCSGNDYVRTVKDTSKKPAAYDQPTSYVYYADAGKNSPHPTVTSLPSISNKSTVNNLQSEINISPNPTNGLFALSVKENIERGVFIYNAMGQLVYQQKINSTQQIDLASQPKGIYFVKIQSADKIFTQKIILQ